MAKREAFSPDQQDLANIFKALGHPARLAILQELARRGSCICGEIVEVMPLSQSTVSQHLKELRDAGLIKGEWEGAKSCYCLDFDTIRRLEAQNSAFITSLLATSLISPSC